MHHRLVILLAAASLTGVGVLVACSSDDGMVPLPGGGTGTSTSGGASSGKSTTGGPTQGDDDDTQPGDDASVDSGCQNAPFLHHTDAGFFCQFLKSNADAGGASTCANDEVCCNSGKVGGNFPVTYCAHADDKNDNGNDTCNTQAAAYGSQWTDVGGSAFECLSAANCGTGQVCCAKSADGADAGNYVNVGTFTGAKAPPAACKAQFMYKLAATKCADQCATDHSEIELCSKNDTCTNGKDCKAAGSGVSDTLDVGYCPF